MVWSNYISRETRKRLKINYVKFRNPSVEKLFDGFLFCFPLFWRTFEQLMHPLFVFFGLNSIDFSIGEAG